MTGVAMAALVIVAGQGAWAADAPKPLTQEQKARALPLLQKAIPGFTGKNAKGDEDSPCLGSVGRLVLFSVDDPAVRQTLDAARIAMKAPPPSAGQTSIWTGKNTVEELVATMVQHSMAWCTALPTITGNSDDGLKYIGANYWFFYQNPAAAYFANGLSAVGSHDPLPDNFNFFREFTNETGGFMDTTASTGTVKEWVNNRRVEIQDYQLQKPEDYKTWNEFFTRELTTKENGEIPGRPVTMPERDYVVSSPTDCIMNPVIQVLQRQTDSGVVWDRKYIENPLQQDTVIDIKGVPLSMKRLLTGVPDDIAATFEGGTGLSCVLMPNTYHHYHAPVSGEVVYARVVGGTTYGYVDWPNLMPSNHNPFQLGSDFSQFEIYQRGIVIIKVTYSPATPGSGMNTGYVASIPVGLDTIGSVVLEDAIKPTGNGANPVVTRGVSRLGHFRYGGSMNLLLFSKGLATGSVQTRLGNQIGILNTDH